MSTRRANGIYSDCSHVVKANAHEAHVLKVCENVEQYPLQTEETEEEMSWVNHEEILKSSRLSKYTRNNAFALILSM